MSPDNNQNDSLNTNAPQVVTPSPTSDIAASASTEAAAVPGFDRPVADVAKSVVGISDSAGAAEPVAPTAQETPTEPVAMPEPITPEPAAEAMSAPAPDAPMTNATAPMPDPASSVANVYPEPANPAAAPSSMADSAKKSSKLPKLAVVFAVALVLIVTSYFIFKPKTNNTSTGSAGLASTQTISPAQKAATDFVKAIQTGNKSAADALESAKFQLKTNGESGSPSYYNYCTKPVTDTNTCGSFKQIDLATAKVTTADAKIFVGGVTADLTQVTFTSKSSTATNTLVVSVSANGKNWQVEDVQQSNAK